MKLYDIPVTTLEGEETTLAPYQGRVLLIVNVASRCGYTPQYEGLEALWRRHRDRGLTVLGFPCNQFGRQEPGDAEAIRSFCSLTYEVTFPLFAKIKVNGPQAHPLYRHLKAAARGPLRTQRIQWNFTKFLVDRGGAVAARFGTREAPESLEPAIVALLD